MKIYDQILQKFKTDDNQLYFSAEANFSKEDLPSYGFFKTIVDEAIPKRDKVKITMNGDSEYDSLDFSNTSAEQFKAFLTETENVDVLIEIDKQVEENEVSVYNYNSFIRNLDLTDELLCLEFFAEISNKFSDVLTFKIYDSCFEERYYSTTSYKFQYYLDGLNCNSNILKNSRKNKLDKVRFTTGFYNFSQYPLLPDDFHIISNDFEPIIEEKFNRWETLFSGIYISTFTIINNNLFQMSSLSMKKITEEQMIESVGYDEELFEIYNWVFKGQNYLDKLAIVRNVIDNLGFKFYNHSLSVQDILVIYNLYLQSKTEEFLKAKNDVGNFIATTLYELDQYTNVIAGSLSNNFFALVAFVTTTIIANIVSDSPLNNIFTHDVLLLSMVILIGSFFYCIISNLKFNRDLEKIDTIFSRLKNNYEEVFPESELEKIFNTDEFNKQKEKIRIFRCNINIIWLGSTLFLILGVLILLKQ